MNSVVIRPGHVDVYVYLHECMNTCINQHACGCSPRKYRQVFKKDSQSKQAFIGMAQPCLHWKGTNVGWCKRCASIPFFNCTHFMVITIHCYFLQCSAHVYYLIIMPICMFQLSAVRLSIIRSCTFY